MKGVAHTLKHLYAGQSLMRIQMNEALLTEKIRGFVADIGGGRNPDYFTYIQTEPGSHIESIDGSFSGIDFEKDPLPFANSAVDTVLLCNVLEHIYNYQFLLGEVRRILAKKGKVIGIVPFWVGYHPDPHDYFRYTAEALEKMLSEAGFVSIAVRPLGGGPLLANFNTIVLSLPRVLRPVLYLVYALFNHIFVSVRPASSKRQPLGFLFTAQGD